MRAWVRIKNFLRARHGHVAIMLVPIALGSVAQASNNSTGHPLPPSIERARTAVLQIFSAGETSRESGRLDMTYERLVQLRKKSAIDASNEFELSQIEHCEATEASVCRISEQRYQSTGFVTGDSKTLFATLHAFLPEFRSRLIMYPFDAPTRHLLGIAPYLNLRRLNGEVVNARSVRLASVSDSAGLFSIDPESKFTPEADIRWWHQTLRFQDVVTFRTASALTDDPLVVSPSAPEPGDTAYIVGFVGDNQIVTRGKFLSAPDYIQRTRETALEGSQHKDLMPYLVFTDFECFKGMSGSPILNDRGEVVAIFTTRLKELAPSSRRNGQLANILCSGIRIER